MNKNCKFAPKERSEYIKQMITIRDIVNQLATAEEKGEAKTMRKMASKMLAAGEDVSRVADFTGLTSEEISSLQGTKP